MEKEEQANKNRYPKRPSLPVDATKKPRFQMMTTAFVSDALCRKGSKI